MRFLKGFIFYLLMFFREIILWALGWISGIMLTLCVVFLVIHKFPKDWAIMYGATSFISFLLMQGYDQLLLWLNPTRHELILFQ